ncbi:hypothetical protein ACMD2_16584, partial [Ananas comosus]
MNLPLSNVATHPRIRDNINFHPFKNAIGAIDGTHIPVCRKEWAIVFSLSQGIYVTKYDGCRIIRPYFLLHLHWFGRIGCRYACSSMGVRYGGFTVLESKYYLVDLGYANTDQFLAPYRDERYHLSQFDTSTRARTHQNSRDLYNHRHAQLRNVVEKSFGILKKRFKILTQATPFSIKVQCLILMACYSKKPLRAMLAIQSLFQVEVMVRHEGSPCGALLLTNYGIIDPEEYCFDLV